MMFHCLSCTSIMANLYHKSPVCVFAVLKLDNEKLSIVTKITIGNHSFLQVAYDF